MDLLKDRDEEVKTRLIREAVYGTEWGLENAINMLDRRPYQEYINSHNYSLRDLNL